MTARIIAFPSRAPSSQRGFVDPLALVRSFAALAFVVGLLCGLLIAWLWRMLS